MLTMYQQITIQTLAKQGKKKTEIAREMGCHRNTVRNIILVGSAREKQTRIKSSYFAPYHDQIKTWVDKDVSALRMYELLTETYHITRTYDSLCKYIQKEFPKTPEAYGVQVISPGEEAEVDFWVCRTPTGECARNSHDSGENMGALCHSLPLPCFLP